MGTPKDIFINIVCSINYLSVADNKTFEIKNIFTLLKLLNFFPPPPTNFSLKQRTNEKLNYLTTRKPGRLGAFSPPIGVGSEGDGGRVFVSVSNIIPWPFSRA